MLVEERVDGEVAVKGFAPTRHPNVKGALAATAAAAAAAARWLLCSCYICS